MGDLFNTGIRPSVDEYLEKLSQERRSYGDYWSASSAGYCMRKNIFERLQVPYVAQDARKQRVFSVGHIFHEWIQGITKETGLSIAQELELQDEELKIRGHIDDLILIPSNMTTEVKVIDGQKVIDEYGVMPNLILYDYKTAHSRSFTYQKDRPMSHYHRYQLATYMLMLKKLAKEELARRGNA